MQFLEEVDHLKHHRVILRLYRSAQSVILHTTALYLQQ